MKNNSNRDILWMGLIIAAVIGINVITASRPPQQFTMIFLVAQIVIFLCYIGWIGLGELRRVEKLGLVRSFQVIIVVLALPVLFSSSVSLRLILLILCGVTMLTAFAIGMWYKHFN